MVRFLFAAFIGAACLQDDAAVEAALKGWRHPWAEFAEGASVTYKETSKRPEIDAGGNLVLKNVETQVVWTLSSVDGERGVLKIASEGRESDVPHHFGRPTWAKGKGERKADEELAVGGAKFLCRVTSIVVDAGKDASETTTVWQNPDAPGWAVKFVNETFVRGKRNTMEEELLIAVDEKVKVGDRPVACAVVQVTTEVEGGARTVRKEWRSDEVPGRLVRQETRHFRGGREIEAAASKKEVVAFRGRK